VGLAASAASTIAMAGDDIRIGQGAFIMIHKAWCLTIGDADAHLETTELLTKIDGALADVYARRTGMDPSAAAELMAAQTWLTADEAVAHGFADSLIDPPKAALARFNLAAVYSNVPAELNIESKIATRIGSSVELERVLRTGGLSNRAAAIVAKAGWAELSKNDGDATEQAIIDQLATRLAQTNAALAVART
jgi:hypothetical protein